MRDLKFKYLGAWNFMCFGPDGIELDLTTLGNLVLIRGLNLDVKPVGAEGTLFPDADEEEQERLSSNGTGKSTIPEILCWCLFGKTIKNNAKIKMDDVIHNIIGEKCKVEVRWDKYRVIRERPKAKKGKLFFYEEQEDGTLTDLTQGTMDATQAKIIKELGLTFEAFLNICVFADDPRMSFLESETEVKQNIVETLMSLGDCKEWHEAAKNFLKEAKKAVKNLLHEFEILTSHLSAAAKRIERAKDEEENWKKERLSELRAFKVQIDAARKKMEESDFGAALLKYQEAQERIREISEIIPGKEREQEKRETLLAEANAKLEEMKEKGRLLSVEANDLMGRIKDNQKKADKAQRDIDGLQEDGASCFACYGKVDKKNAEHVIQKAKNIIQAAESEIKADTTRATLLTEKIEQLNAAKAKVQNIVDTQREKQKTVSTEIGSLSKELGVLSQIREPKADSDALLLEQQITSLKQQALEKKKEYEGRSPYAEIIADSERELLNSKKTCDEKKKEIEEAEAEIPYYEYWSHGFGPDGIRKWVIEGIIPALNAKIDYWLQFLIENKVKLTFDSKLDETIHRNPRDGEKFVYHAMSTGERRRLNLAVSQAFAHVMSISTGTNPSVVFLDEVTTNIDPLGVQGIYNMICELSEDKQVFVTTHDHDLLKMMETAHVIRLQRKGGITRMLPNKTAVSS